MKRALFVLLLIGVGAFPYAVLLGILRNKPVYTELAFALGLACAVVLFIWSRRGFWSARHLALASMIVKLAQIPAYVIWFVLGVSFFLFGFAAAAFIVDAAAILFSGLVGLAAVRRCRTEGKLERKAAILHGILQFLFCVDVISAIMLYRKTKEVSP